MTPEILSSLQGKTALVTGGATGIGRMAAQGLAAAGANVLICSRKAHACVATAEEINALGLSGKVTGFGGDVSTEQGVADVVADLSKHTDKLHILMNNAGRTWGAPLGDVPFDSWEKVNSLNVAGMFHLTQSLLDLLESSSTKDDPARIVNVASIMGQIAMGDGAYSYAVSKAAVIHMTKILGRELANRHITANAIAPGPFVSKMTAFAIGEEEAQDRVGSRVPLGRVGRPEDVAASMQFLCGLGGSYVTGMVIPLSGGMQVETGGSLFG